IEGLYPSGAQPVGEEEVDSFGHGLTVAVNKADLSVPLQGPCVDRDVHLAQPDEPAYSAARKPGDGITQSRLPRLAGHFPQEPPDGGRAAQALRVTVIQLVDSSSDLNFHVVIPSSMSIVPKPSPGLA